MSYKTRVREQAALIWRMWQEIALRTTGDILGEVNPSDLSSKDSRNAYLRFCTVLGGLHATFDELPEDQQAYFIKLGATALSKAVDAAIEEPTEVSLGIAGNPGEPVGEGLVDETSTTVQASGKKKQSLPNASGKCEDLIETIENIIDAAKAGEIPTNPVVEKDDEGYCTIDVTEENTPGSEECSANEEAVQKEQDNDRLKATKKAKKDQDDDAQFHKLAYAMLMGMKSYLMRGFSTPSAAGPTTSYKPAWDRRKEKNFCVYLKKCPFCGNAPIRSKVRDRNGIYKLTCPKKSCTLGKADLHYKHWNMLAKALGQTKLLNVLWAAEILEKPADGKPKMDYTGKLADDEPKKMKESVVRKVSKFVKEKKDRLNLLADVAKGKVSRETLRSNW